MVMEVYDEFQIAWEEAVQPRDKVAGCSLSMDNRTDGELCSLEALWRYHNQYLTPARMINY